MRIVQLSDTHGCHKSIKTLPDGDVLIHCGDFTHYGIEEEVLDFLNWFETLAYKYKIFVTGNHDLCLWDAESIQDLPDNMFFLQDKGITIEGKHFFGIGYNHDVSIIPDDLDVLVTHEPPLHILDMSTGVNWGNFIIQQQVFKLRPRFHLFGHSHEAHGVVKHDGIVFSNASLLDERGNLSFHPVVFDI